MLAFIFTRHLQSLISKSLKDLFIWRSLERHQRLTSKISQNKNLSQSPSFEINKSVCLYTSWWHWVPWKTGKKCGLISEEDLHSSKGSPISLIDGKSVSNTPALPVLWSTTIWPRWLTFPICQIQNVFIFRTHLFSVDFLGLYCLEILTFPSPWCVQAEPMVFFQSSCQIYWKNGQACFLVNSSIKWLKIRYCQPSGKPWHLVSNIKHFCHDSTNFTGIQLSCLKSVDTSE